MNEITINAILTMGLLTFMALCMMGLGATLKAGIRNIR